MSANGISSLPTKEDRQKGKLDLAQAKRQGQTITEGGGTWSADGIIDSTKHYYRDYNSYNLDLLPTQYVGDTVSDNANVGGLQPHRPWTPTI